METIIDDLRYDDELNLDEIIVPGKITDKKIKGEDGKDIINFTIPIYRRHDGKDYKLAILGPEIVSFDGIQLSQGKYGSQYQIKVWLDNTDPEQAKFIKLITDVQMRCARILSKVKGDVRMPDFSMQLPFGTGLVPLLYYPLGPDQEKDYTRKPSLYIELFHTVNEKGKVWQTTIVDADGDEKDWIRLLLDEGIKFRPTVSIGSIYVAAKKAYTKLRMTNAVILDTVERPKRVIQQRTLEELKNDAEKRERSKASFAKLEVKRQEKLVPVPSSSPSSSEADPANQMTNFMKNSG
jgi:hypothetical protein